MAYLLMLGWGALLIGMSYLCKRMWLRMLGRAYRIVALPGILIHELSHATGCLITGAKITGFSLFEPGGGYVEHEPPKLPLLGAPVISLAPVVGCGVGLWCVTRLFGLTEFGGEQLPDTIGLTPTELGSFAEGFFQTIWYQLRMIRGVNVTQLSTLVGTYLALTFGVSLGPSRDDLRNAALGVAAWSGLVYVAHWVARAFGRQQGLTDVLLRPLWPGLSGLVALLAILLAATAILFGIRMVVLRLAGRRRIESDQ